MLYSSYKTGKSLDGILIVRINMKSQNNIECNYLEIGVAKLRPLLVADGFKYYSGDQAASSGGSFATGFFRKGNLEIGLIVRNRKQLGCPNYSEGHGYAGHTDLFSALGRQEEQNLVAGDYLSYQAKDGGDPFDALFTDFEQVILPALRKSPIDFSAAISRAHKMFQNSLRGK